MEILTHLIGNTIYLYEYVKDWCYFYNQSHNDFEFIELDTGKTIYSFSDVFENVRFITVHYIIFNKPFQLILHREKGDDFSFENKFQKIMKCAFSLPNVNVPSRSIHVKHKILSAVATDLSGETYHFTQQLNELSGPNGDFYAFSGRKTDMSLLLQKLGSRNGKTYTDITYIDDEADTHILQREHIKEL